MENKEVKTTITLDGQTHTIYISRERAEQIKRLQSLIKEGKSRKEHAPQPHTPEGQKNQPCR